MAPPTPRVFYTHQTIKVRVKRRKRPAFRARELNVEQILRWADAWFARFGRWPKGNSGQIPGSGGDTWTAIDVALYQGHRGLPGGTTLGLLLAANRDAPYF